MDLGFGLGLGLGLGLTWRLALVIYGTRVGARAKE